MSAIVRYHMKYLLEHPFESLPGLDSYNTKIYDYEMFKNLLKVYNNICEKEKQHE